MVSLTKSLQEDGVSGLNLLLVQQAEETTRHVDHILDVEKQAVQVGQRRLPTQAYHNLLSSMYVKQNSTNIHVLNKMNYMRISFSHITF